MALYVPNIERREKKLHDIDPILPNSTLSPEQQIQEILNSLSPHLSSRELLQLKEGFQKYPHALEQFQKIIKVVNEYGPIHLLQRKERHFSLEEYCEIEQQFLDCFALISPQFSQDAFWVAQVERRLGTKGLNNYKHQKVWSADLTQYFAQDELKRAIYSSPLENIREKKGAINMMRQLTRDGLPMHLVLAGYMMDRLVKMTQFGLMTKQASRPTEYSKQIKELDSYWLRLAGLLHDLGRFWNHDLYLHMIGSKAIALLSGMNPELFFDPDLSGKMGLGKEVPEVHIPVIGEHISEEMRKQADVFLVELAIRKYGIAELLGWFGDVLSKVVQKKFHPEDGGMLWQPAIPTPVRPHFETRRQQGIEDFFAERTRFYKEEHPDDPWIALKHERESRLCRAIFTWHEEAIGLSSEEIDRYLFGPMSEIIRSYLRYSAEGLNGARKYVLMFNEEEKIRNDYLLHTGVKTDPDFIDPDMFLYTFDYNGFQSVDDIPSLSDLSLR